MTYTAADKLKAIDRELGYRLRVYARRISEGQMTKEFAEEQIKIFEAIRDDYKNVEFTERLL